MIELITGFLIACAFTGVKTNDVISALKNIMAAICICSLITLLLIMIKLGIITRLRFFHQVIMWFAIFGIFRFLVSLKKCIARNYDIFWEPGAFLTYIILLLLYELLEHS